ncbi:hypothetical protein NA78x_000519 [Anatilimnocola sp. NA78]|uniref:hypothetical protein n=1 Tax=Anatilimnocola sp. NA78 TaxID=3415683 RepID=UPI003CE4A1A4
MQRIFALVCAGAMIPILLFVLWASWDSTPDHRIYVLDATTKRPVHNANVLIAPLTDNGRFSQLGRTDKRGILDVGLSRDHKSFLIRAEARGLQFAGQSSLPGEPADADFVLLMKAENRIVD